MTDSNIIPFERRECRELTKEERQMVQLIQDFADLGIDGQLEVLFAACEADELASISRCITEYLRWASSR